jgi:eukaryotic-like serine/threonine-protein kinase
MRLCPPAEQLDALLAGTLGPDETADVSAHVERCKSCRAALEALTAEPASHRWANLRSNPETLPDGPTPAFLARLQQVVQRKSSRAGATSIGRIAAADDTQPSAPSGPVAPPGYDILGYLGRGGMGVVHKARHRALKRVVALKMLRPEAVGEADQRARLLGEAETVARLHHPNVAQVFEVGEQDGVPYVALEYVEGPTLSQVLGGRPQPPRLSAGLIATLARAAHHAHSVGVVHRDLKPGNILLAPLIPNEPPTLEACVPKITDFGLAKRLDDISHTQTGLVVGTPCYMAPEQARGPSGGVTPLADVYALGAVLYEMLTGRPPLVGLTTVDTVVRVLNEDPSRPRSIVPGIPVDLETVCLKCLEKDPRRRYRSAEALADDLDRFLAGTSVLARPLGRPARAWRWARRHPTAAALLAVLTAVAAFGFPGATALWLDARASEHAALTAGERARVAEDEAVRARTEIARQSAPLMADRGLKLADDGNIGEGLVWMAEALAVCPTETDAVQALREILRANLADWATLMPRPVAALDVDEVTRAAFSDDGRFVAVGNYDGITRVWDADTGAPVAGPFVTAHVVTDLAFRPDGRELLVGYGARRGTTQADHLFLRWDLATGQRVGPERRASDGWMHVAWSPDGRTVAVAGRTEVRLWDVASGDPAGGPWTTTNEIKAVRFTPDGKFLLVGPGRVYVQGGWQHEGKIERIEIATGARSTLVENPTGCADLIELTADRRLLGTGDFERGALVQPLDPATGDPVGPAVPLPGGFGGLSADGGTVLLTDRDHSIRFADRRTGRISARIRPTWGDFGAVRIAPAGDRFFSRSELWTLPRPRSRPPATSPGDVPTLARCSVPVAGRFGLVRKQTLSVVDRSGREIGPAIDKTTTLALLSPDGTRVATGIPQPDPHATVLAVYDVRTGTRVAGPLRFRQIGSVAFSRDGRRLAVGTFGWTLFLHDLASGTTRKLPDATDIITALDFSPDGRWLAVGLSDDYNHAPGVRFLDLATGDYDGGLLSHLDGGLRQVAFSPDGGRLFAGSATLVRIWDVETRSPIDPPIPVVGVPPARPFSPDGRWVACQTAPEQMRVYSAATGKAAGPPVGGDAAVTCYQFSPDSRWLLIGHADGTARVWDLATMRPRGPRVAQRHRVVAVDWAADGAGFVTVSATGAVRHWPLTPPAPDDPAALRAAVELLTAARMDTGPAVSPLSRDEWRARFAAFPAAHGSFDRVLGAGVSVADWHNERARDAEEESDGPTALYHLDRRLTLVPTDAEAVLRRMHRYALAGDWAAAAADRRRALDLVGPDEVAAWCRHYELACQLGGRVEAEKWYAEQRADRERD